LDWPLLFGSLESCDALLSVFEEVIHKGLDLLMPVSKVRLNTRDAPWMTQHLKDLIQKLKGNTLSTKRCGFSSIQVL